MVYSLIAVVAMALLVLLVGLCWCSKARTRKKERFERRNSIRMSKSSLAGSRSLAGSMQSAGFSDINYRYVCKCKPVVSKLSAKHKPRSIIDHCLEVSYFEIISDLHLDLNVELIMEKPHHLRAKCT